MLRSFRVALVATPGWSVRRAFWLLTGLLLLLGQGLWVGLCAPEFRDGVWQVFPGDSIQDAIEAAATNPPPRRVSVHPGEYGPRSRGQALLWFNRRHDGVQVRALGRVVLTAVAKDASASRTQWPGYPAIVNHLVYFGDGVGSNTVLQGFTLTGANGFVTDKLTHRIEPDRALPKNLFFYTDGGAIKVFGRSSPTLRELRVENNYASPCGGGISVQQLGYREHPVRIENSVFIGNRAQVTGAAIDLLEGSAAIIENCLFVGNVSNTGEDRVARRSGETPFTNNGAVTLFQNCQAVFLRCTFTGNRNGVDDMGGLSRYEQCLFSGNTLPGTGGVRFELDLPAGGNLVGCHVAGPIQAPPGKVQLERTHVGGPEVLFDSQFVPRAPIAAGYRPVRPAQP